MTTSVNKSMRNSNENMTKISFILKRIFSSNQNAYHKYMFSFKVNMRITEVLMLCVYKIYDCPWGLPCLR